MASAPECVWPVDAELGEGPIWSARESAVWFVDIKGRRIHRFDTMTREGRSWPAPAQVSFIAPVHGGGFVCGLQTGLYRFDPQTGAFAFLMAVEPHLPDNRLNDCHVDDKGRLWFGSMHDGEKEKTGTLYRLSETGPVACDALYGITNGPAISPDGRTLYHTDTAARTTFAFDLADDGTLSNKRVFVQTEAPAVPDGPVVDAEGCVWNSLYNGWGINRYSPKGELIEFIRFPVANVTKVAFGGADLRDVYATTAWMGMTAEARAAQPLAGGLFKLRSDVPGLPQAEVRDGI